MLEPVSLAEEKKVTVEVHLTVDLAKEYPAKLQKHQEKCHLQRNLVR